MLVIDDGRRPLILGSSDPRYHNHAFSQYTAYGAYTNIWSINVVVAVHLLFLSQPKVRF